LSQYGYFYNTSAQTVSALSAVTFDTNGVTTGGITHLTGTSTIVVSSTGQYHIAFSVSGTAVANQLSLEVNGVAVAGLGQIGALPNTGEGIIPLTAGDILTLVNTSTLLPITLLSTTGTSQNNASILIEQLSSAS
jgi:hypothetical protein